MFAMQNRAEEQNPCPIIILWAPSSPQFVNLIIPVKTKVMWDTEDKAISTLISVWKKQVRAAKIPPRQAQIIKK
jgi:hypothetical protein